MARKDIECWGQYWFNCKCNNTMVKMVGQWCLDVTITGLINLL